MKIYTKTGDQGMTEVIGGHVDKDDPRVEALGAVDELNAYLGLAMVSLHDAPYTEMAQDLTDIQQHLFECCADLATVAPTRREYAINAAMVTALEQRIDHYARELAALTQFILPGGSQPAALLHVCRAVTRRAERRVVSLARQDAQMNPVIIRYLNRLSDFLFVLARVCNARSGISDVCGLKKP